MESSSTRKIREALGLLASAIRSGESWTPTCERITREAFDELDVLARPARWVSVETALPEDIGIKYDRELGGVWDGVTRLPVLWPNGRMTLESPMAVLNYVRRPQSGDAVPTHWHYPLPSPPPGATEGESDG